MLTISEIGGVLAYGVSRGFDENKSITFPAWKAMFLITGLVTTLFGALMFFFFPDSPASAKWLGEEERVIAIERLRGNQQGLGSKVFKMYQVKEAFTDPRVCLCPFTSSEILTFPRPIFLCFLASQLIFQTEELLFTCKDKQIAFD